MGKGAEPLTSITDARGVAFLDLDEDVRHASSIAVAASPIICLPYLYIFVPGYPRYHRPENGDANWVWWDEGDIYPE